MLSSQEHLWRPGLQEVKISNTGGENVRYRHGYKGRLLAELRGILEKWLPFCPVRYAF